MSKRRLRSLCADAEHYRLALRYRNSRGGEKSRALKELKDYVKGLLRG